MPTGGLRQASARHEARQPPVSHSNEWAHGKRASSTSFPILMIPREPNDHYTDRYFCLCNSSAYSLRTRSRIIYSNVAFEFRQIPRSDELSA